MGRAKAMQNQRKRRPALAALQDQKPVAQEERKKEKTPVNKRLEERKKNFQARKLRRHQERPEEPEIVHDLDATRQGAGYDDPDPTSTTNFAAYFTELTKMTNGTQITFGTSATASGDYQWLPTQIKDRNGNFLTIVYKHLSNNDTVLDYVLDTLGRRIDFYYQNNRLTEIRQDRNGTIFKYAIIDYTAITLSGTFWNPATYSYHTLDVSGTSVYVPSRITYPTGMNLRFAYNTYGQVNQIEKWVPTISGQGSERRIAHSTLTLATMMALGNGIGLDRSPFLQSRGEFAENSGLGTSAYGYSSGGFVRWRLVQLRRGNGYRTGDGKQCDWQRA